MLGLIDDTRKDVETVESSLKSEFSEQYSALMRTTDAITAEIHEIENDLTESIEAKMTTDDFELNFNQMMSGGGADQIVIKNRDFSFDYEGLTIADSTSDLSTNIDIDGMKVEKNGNAILTAGVIEHDDGTRTIEVKAANLHATTYLKVGSGDGHSRFEDYGINRIGCFWTGE